MPEFIFVYITFESQLQAETIGETLVSENLAACVNIFPAMRSIYKWENQVQYSEEVVGIAKTRSNLFNELEVRTKELHTYSNPCIVSLDVTNGSEDFLSWIKTNTK